MSKKFLSDVLIECGLQVSGTTTLGTATATTVATSDNSTNIATTAFVKAQGYITTDSYVSNVSLSGNLLTFTGANNAFNGSIDLSSITSSFNASDVTTVYERVKNTSGDIIRKGTPLAVVPGQTSGNISDVVPADASDAGRMPAVFIANEDIADEAEGEAVLFGQFTGVDTSLYESGTTVYVAPGGGWTATKPIYPNLIQNLGVITKQHPTNGGGIVTGVGRANALPNLTAGKIWVGSANYPVESTTVHVDEANARVGIGTTSPAYKLDVTGQIRVNNGVGNGSGQALIVGGSGDVTLTSGGSLFFGAYDYAGSTYIRGYDNSAGLYLYADGFNIARFGSTSAQIDKTLIVAEGIRLTNSTASIYGDSVGYLHFFGYTNVYFDNNIIARGGITNDGGDVTVNDNLLVNGVLKTTGSLLFDDLVSNVIQHKAGNDINTLVTVGHGGFDHNGYLRLSGADVATQAWVTAQGYITSETDSQTLSWDAPSKTLEISNGNNVTLDGLATEEFVTGQGYITTYTETDTLAAVVSRGNSTSSSIRVKRPSNKVDNNSNPIEFGGRVEFNNDFVTGESGYMVFRYPTYNNFLIGGDFDGNIGGGIPNIQFGRSNGTVYMHISANNGSGNVGIGNTTPGYKLDVTGDINFTNTLKFGGTTVLSNAASDVYGNIRVLYSASTISDGMYINYNSAGGTGADLRLFANGTNERIRIKADSGNVGIGTTAPTSKLHVASGNIEIDNGYYLQSRTSGGSNLFPLIGMSSNEINVGNWEGAYMGNLYLKGGNGSVFADFSQGNNASFRVRGVAGSTPTEYFRVTAAGKVGIGTTNPAHKLHVSTGVKANSLYVGMSDDFTSRSGDGDNVYIKHPLKTGGGWWGVNVELSGAVSGHTATFYPFRYLSDENSDGSADTIWSFIDKNGGAYFAGNVGIGTSSPFRKFQVDGSAGVRNGSFFIGDESGSTNSGIEFYKSGTTLRLYTNTGAFGGTYGASSAAIALYDGSNYNTLINGNGNSYFNNGNVGIGTTSPGSKLDVNGVVLGSGFSSRNFSSTVQGFSIESGDSTVTTYRFDADRFRFYSGNYGEIVSIKENGNVGISTTNPGEKLHVVGKVRIDSGSTSTTFQAVDKPVTAAGVIIESYDAGSTYGAFVDYVIYDAGRDNMRVGTMRAVWNLGEAIYTDVSTVDIGDTSSVNLSAVISGANVNLVVTGEEIYTIKASVKIIR